MRCEYFNMEWRRNLKIGECSKIAHGWSIFVEEIAPGTPYDQFNWKREMDEQKEKITFSFTKQSDSSQFKISLSQSLPVSHLKELVSARISAPVDKFYFVSSCNGREVKEQSKPVSSLGLTAVGNRLDIIMGKSKLEG